MATAYSISHIYEHGQIFLTQDRTGDEEPLDEEPGGPQDQETGSTVGLCILRNRNKLSACLLRNKALLKLALFALLTALYFAYFIYAMVRFEGEGSWRLLVITILVVLFVLLRKLWGNKARRCMGPLCKKLKHHEEKLSWIAVSIIWLVVIIIAIYDVLVVTKDVYNLVSFAGIFVLIIISFLFSKHKSKISWRPVVWGLGLQFVLALLILRLNAGYLAFSWLGDRVGEFLSHVGAGTRFLFGSKFKPENGTYDQNGVMHFLAMEILPVIFLTSCCVSLLYHLGFIHYMIVKMAIIMRVTMATTAAESLSAAGNIFLGMTEAPLMVRPLLPTMTVSELHALMSGGFATIAGNMLAAYVSLGVPANHMLSASIMSAPAALAISKIIYPETERVKSSKEHNQRMTKSPAHNFFHALYLGAASAISLLASILANLLAFVALLHFVNQTLTWFGARVGLEELTLQFICSYLLWPLAFIMGVETADCRKVAELIGIKTILNDFVAYQKLVGLIKNTEKFSRHVSGNGTWFHLGENIVLQNYTTGEVLAGGVLQSERSVVISTYALCGFANFGSIGILLGSLSAMIPGRKRHLAAIALSSMMAGNMACFLTACIAGVFYQPINTS